MTKHRSNEGRVYLSVVIDVFHRHGVSWVIDDVLNTDLVLNAFSLVQRVRRTESRSMHYSSQGSRFGSLRVGRHRRASGVGGGMAHSGKQADNAVAERSFATLRTELLDRNHWPTRNDPRVALHEDVCSRHPRHSCLGNPTSAEYRTG